MPTIPFRDKHPLIRDPYFIAPDAWIIGDVEIAATVSIFFHVVIRGDIEPIRVGSGSNIQEHAMLHTSRGLSPCVIGDNVTIGHRAIIHGATVEDNCIIGMGSVVLDGAAVGKNSIIGAQALIPMNMKIPERSLVLGVPAKVVRSLSDEQVESIRQSALSYQKLGGEYRSTLPYQHD